MFTKLITLILLISLISACDNCAFGIASDQLRPADTIEMNNTTYYLYTRTVGWQEKTVFFELYAEEPVYDSCTDNITPNAIFAIHYDYFPNDPNSEEKYVKEIILQPDQAEKLKIIYTKNIEEGVANVYDVKFTNN